jgi:hypothetical protein
MATNYGNTKVLSITTKTTIPEPYQTLTGTMTSVGRIVTGTGTTFTTEIGGGDSTIGLPTIVAGGWLFSISNMEVRQIKDVVSNTQIILEQGFTADVSGVAVLYVPDSRVMQMSWVATAAGAIVDGVTLVQNEGSGVGFTASDNARILAPVVVDGSGGTLHVTIFKGN